jgi:hypothetical protein
LTSVPERRRLRALAQANEVRRARSQLKRDLLTGRVELAEVLSKPPTYAHTAEVRDLLMALPGVGPGKANRALTCCGIPHAKEVTGLSSRQRAALIDFLRR